MSQLAEQATDLGRMRPDFQCDPTARHCGEDFLQRLRIRTDSLLQLYLPGFIHHAVPTVAISQIQSDGQFLLRNIPALRCCSGANLLHCRVFSSRHIEEKITESERSRFLVRVAEQEYVVQNPIDKVAVFLVRHDVPQNWKVDSDPQPNSMDGSTAVFRLNAEPGQRVRLHVGMHRRYRVNPN